MCFNSEQYICRDIRNGISWSNLVHDGPYIWRAIYIIITEREKNRVWIMKRPYNWRAIHMIITEREKKRVWIMKGKTFSLLWCLFHLIFILNVLFSCIGSKLLLIERSRSLSTFYNKKARCLFANFDHFLQKIVPITNL